MTNSFTEEELAALPSTSTVFNQPSLDVDSHDWVQQGYMITDTCSPKTSACQPVGIPIPSGKLLIKKDGRYDLIDETRG
jgi:hypothetical protein